MWYAIETLEIEIARLRQAIRIVQSTVSKAEDRLPDVNEMQHHIDELEAAVRLLIDSLGRNPTEEDLEKVDRTFKNLFGETEL